MGGPFAFLSEAFTQTQLEPPTNGPDRDGFEYGIPEGGTKSARSRGEKLDRRQSMEDLADVYETCIWVSAAVDAEARAVVSGGPELVPDDDLPDADTPTVPPGPVQRCMTLFRYTNARENITQLLRSAVTDLLVFGDAYIEIVSLGLEPVRLWTLDAATMTVEADEHGNVLGYTQVVDSRRSVSFKPEQVIHISLDGPRGGLYGISPTRKVMTAVRTWLWTSATLNEQMKQGNPPRLHIDLPEEVQGPALKRFFNGFMMRNRGVKNIGTPLLTRGGGQVRELSNNQIEWLLRTLDKCRDEILSGFGCPPNKAQVIESGNLGGGTGESQDKTWRIDLVMPLQSLIIEALQFRIVQQGFQIRGWHLRIPEIDMRDSEVVEKIRDMRIKNGSMSLNEYLGELGQPGIGGAGDQRVIIDRGQFVLWPDLPAYALAEILKLAPTGLTVTRDGDGTLQAEQVDEPEPEPMPNVLQLPAVAKGAPPGRVDPEGTIAQGRGPRESAPDDAARAVTEAYSRAYAHRRKRALKDLPND